MHICICVCVLYTYCVCLYVCVYTNRETIMWFFKKHAQKYTKKRKIQAFEQFR